MIYMINSYQLIIQSTLLNVSFAYLVFNCYFIPIFVVNVAFQLNFLQSSSELLL